MKSTVVRVGIAVTLLVATVVAFQPQPSAAQADPFVGTWVLNVAKSTFVSGAVPPKEQIVTYEVTGDDVKITVTGTAGNGQPIAISYTGKYDGKDYPMTGNPGADMQSLERVNPNTVEITRKKDGKVVNTATNVVSPDGKTRTLTTTGTGPDGQKISSVSVYDKK